MNNKRILKGTLAGAATVGIADVISKATDQAGWIALGVAGGSISLIAVTTFINAKITDKIADKYKIEDNDELNDIQRKKIANKVEMITGGAVMGLNLAVAALKITPEIKATINNSFPLLSMQGAGMIMGPFLLGEASITNNLSHEESQKYENYKNEQKQLKMTKAKSQ